MIDAVAAVRPGVALREVAGPADERVVVGWRLRLGPQDEAVEATLAGLDL